MGRKAVFQNVRELGAAFERFDRLMQSPEFLDLASALTGIPKLLYDPEYAGGGAHENLSGQDLDPHVDFNFHPRTQLHRRLNLIVFLNPEWDQDWGGALELHTGPTLPAEENLIRKVVPLENRCIIFETSERSWHGFPRIESPGPSRRSIAVYFYTKTRPAGQTAPSHGTFYQPRLLPEHFAPGRVLTDEDVHLLKVLLERRDTQIRFQHQRELDFARIAQSPTYRLVRLLTWPLRILLRR
ncbi:MAG: 2OG-Fe(II) oxygenase [Bryobacteraceae bacterium]